MRSIADSSGRAPSLRGRRVFDCVGPIDNRRQPLNTHDYQYGIVKSMQDGEKPTNVRAVGMVLEMTPWCVSSGPIGASS